MEFVTIHELSRELNVPARVIRYRLILLIAEGKLKENEDFRRDDFKDEQHFVWKINPLSFMRQTNLKPASSVNQVGAHLITPVIKTDNHPLPTVNQPEKDKLIVALQMVLGRLNREVQPSPHLNPLPATSR